MNKLTMGIVAHVDCGKTTLSEALLYETGVIRKLGRVDSKNCFLDSFELERKRGITIFSKQAQFSTESFDVTLLDTPGHVDFSAETERTLSVLDLAIILVSASSGVQSHTETLWALLRKYNIPTFIFINKMDLSNADKETLLKGIKKKLSSNAIPIESFSNSEELAMCSEEMMDAFLSDGKISDEMLKSEILNCHLFPCIFGSALKLDGIKDLLNTIDNYASAPDYSENFGAKVFKITHRENGERLTHMKITGGKLSVKDFLEYCNQSGKIISEKIEQIRIFQGDKYTAVNQVSAGTICAVTGPTELVSGSVLGYETASEPPVLTPILSYRINLPKDIDEHTALSKLRILEAEDPMLKVTFNEDLKEIHLLLMGEIQLEVITHQIVSRFGFTVTFSDGGIVYRETITDTVEGVGHYEPLRHYSEVHLLLSPAERGTGLIFDTDCDTDFLEKNWQRLILTHLEEKTHLGVLTGSPITDIKITLVSGKAHKKHTEGGDFRQATYRAVRQGLMKAKSVLLEPWYNYEITVPSENIGRVMTDIQKMSGTMNIPENDGELATLKGTAPVSEMRLYSSELASFTRGTGRINLNLKGYDLCHNSNEVINSIGYSAEADLKNSPDSIFCSGGSALFVRWNEVESYMHLPSIFTIDKEELEQKKELKRRAAEYCSAVATDKELMEIFEKTYGPIRKRQEPKTKFNPSVTKPQKTVKAKPSHTPTGPEYLLIDGYNIIFAWEELKKTAMSNLEHARHELTERLCNYQGFSKQEIILVFDAYKVHKNPGSIESFRNIKVVYTKEAETADTYIEKAAYKLSKDHIVRVATSDGPEQMIILGSGALRVPAISFIKELTDAEKAIREFLSD